MNYQIELEKIMKEQEEGASLFLHSCCAPCSSYVLSYLSSFFDICVFYYNPNITDEEEYQKRVKEQEEFINKFNEKEQPKYPVSFLQGSYDKMEFFNIAKGYETCKEGGERCFRCYRLRLKEAARRASEGKFDFFATTLTISPLKNAAKLNEIGFALEVDYGVKYLPSDFKKKNGYKRSTELSKEYGLYRQDYCGCVYSKEK